MRDPSGHVAFARTSVAAASVRAYTLRLDGAVFDSAALLGATTAMKAGPSSPHVMTIVLEGEQIVRASGRASTIRAGRAVLAGGRAWNERWDGGRYRSLTIEIDDPSTSRRDAPVELTTSPGLLAAARELADRLESHAAIQPHIDHEIAAFLEQARAEGHAFGDFDLRAMPRAPRDAQRLVDCRSWAESHLDEKPMWIDWAARMDMSERQLRRRLDELQPWSRLIGGTLRAQLRFLRAQGAAILLASDTHKVDAVARAVGYGGERALATALAEMSLGSPRALGRAVVVGA